MLAIPLFLPNMHERYFYLADIITIIYAFYFPTPVLDPDRYAARLAAQLRALPAQHRDHKEGRESPYQSYF
ncbi:MAG TPA: hypothetical protein VGD58_25615 [Herpetosiphonaceae bacterium]